MDRAITERGGGGVLGFLNFPLRYLVMKKKKKRGGLTNIGTLRLLSVMRNSFISSISADGLGTEQSRERKKKKKKIISRHT